jgi:excinuclease ABC subunit A
LPAVEIPVGKLTVVCGVSGSGKSSLLWEVLAPLAESVAGAGASVGGLEAVARIKPERFSGARRSMVLTAIDLMGRVRELFASLSESKIRGYTADKFGVSSPGGRCEACKGEGLLRDPSGYEETECPVCLGKRYRDEILEVRFKSLSIAEVLDLTVESALKIFSAFRGIAGRLQPLFDCGLGYLRLGQPTSHLSGGELQRLRLAQELGKARPPRTLYLFDEPARGLSPSDVEVLLALLRGLTEKGHTVVAIEHHRIFRAQADWVVELSPPERGG